ncbi:MAG: hypothetical protein CL584_03865 [Alteromonadaceae bacterium]|nr:hypothetical protein [Alteromonadaceae bacterium]|tara:strand:+ start:4939 stop:5331 length:393 start_codon:yes stop_codon:yes gene_type:complete
MRSRFSAYCLSNWAYILKTYAKQQRDSLTEQALEENASGTKWLALSVVISSSDAQHISTTTDQVEFKAYYAVNHKPYLMHETSDFVMEDNEWRYTTGIMHNDSGLLKTGRNDPCFCDSGKKFKQCCLKRM